MCLPDDWGDGYKNVWLGVSVESDNEKHRIETLAKVPAKIRFISAEPLIGPINLKPLKKTLEEDFQWIILGGESGNQTGKYLYRECEEKWLTDLISISQETDVKVFVKQLGTFLAKKFGYKDRHGGDIMEWESHLQIREFPESIDQFVLE
jgi:protein gp37